MQVVCRKKRASGVVEHLLAGWDWLLANSEYLPGDPKLLMTLQFPRKVSIDFFKIRGSKIRERGNGK